MSNHVLPLTMTSRSYRVSCDLETIERAMEILQSLGVKNATGLSASAFYERVKDFQNTVYLTLRNNPLSERSEYTFARVAAFSVDPLCINSVISALEELLPVEELEPVEDETVSASGPYLFARIVCKDESECKLVTTYLKDLGRQERGIRDSLSLNINVSFAGNFQRNKFFDQNDDNTIEIRNPLWDLQALKARLEALQEPVEPLPKLQNYRTSYDDVEKSFQFELKTLSTDAQVYKLSREQVESLDEFYQTFPTCPDMKAVEFDSGLRLTVGELEELHEWLKRTQ